MIHVNITNRVWTPSARSGHPFGMPPRGYDREAQRATARRLRDAQEAINPNQTAFANKAGIEQNAFSQFVSRTKPRALTVDAALKLAETYGLSLDWLYRGDTMFMPAGLLGRIEAFQTGRSSENN